MASDANNSDLIPSLCAPIPALDPSASSPEATPHRTWPAVSASIVRGTCILHQIPDGAAPAESGQTAPRPLAERPPHISRLRVADHALPACSYPSTSFLALHLALSLSLSPRRRSSRPHRYLSGLVCTRCLLTPGGSHSRPSSNSQPSASRAPPYHTLRDLAA